MEKKTIKKRPDHDSGEAEGRELGEEGGRLGHERRGPALRGGQQRGQDGIAPPAAPAPCQPAQAPHPRRAGLQGQQPTQEGHRRQCFLFVLTH